MPRLDRHMYDGKAERGARSTLKYLRRIPDELIAGKTILDCGCNVGLVAEWLVAERGAKRVVGFEPHPQAFALAAARGKKVGFEVRQQALMVKAGTFMLATAADDTAAKYYCNSAIKPDGERRQGYVYHEVTGWPFADALRELKPHGIKMDIEGSEYDLLLHVPMPKSVQWLCVEMHGLKTWGSPMLPEVCDRLGAQGFGVHDWPSSLHVVDGAPSTFNPFCEMNFVRGAQTPGDKVKMLRTIRKYYAAIHRDKTPRIRSAARRAMLEEIYGAI